MFDALFGAWGAWGKEVVDGAHGGEVAAGEGTFEGVAAAKRNAGADFWLEKDEFRASAEDVFEHVGVAKVHLFGVGGEVLRVLANGDERAVDDRNGRVGADTKGGGKVAADKASGAFVPATCGDEFFPGDHHAGGKERLELQQAIDDLAFKYA